MLASFKVKLAGYFLLLAVLPLAAAFWGFGTVVTHLGERRVDARLAAELRAGVAAYDRRLAQLAARAHSLAQRPDVQRALAQGKKRVGSDLGAGIRLRPARGSGTVIEGQAAAHAVRVWRGRKLLGAVVAVLPLEAGIAHRLGADAGIVQRDRIVFLWRGRILGSRVSRRRVVPGMAITENLGRKRYRLLATGPLPEQPRARLAVLTRDSAGAEASLTRRQLLFVLLGGLIVIGAVAAAEGRSIMRRLRELAQAATTIGAGRLDRRVPVRGRDEFAELARAFNVMADQLQNRLSELDLQQTRLRESIARFGEVLAATHDLEHLLPAITGAAAEAANATGAILITDAGRVLEIGDPEKEGEWVEVPVAAGTTSFGTIVLVAPRFVEDDLVAARSLAAQAAVAIENARLHEAFERQARVDGLTGLANRRRCEDVLAAEIARAARYESPLAVMLCDLDDFKAANDSLGHALGDRILQEFARVLREAVRDVDVAGRWGGEEFLVVLPGTGLEGGVEAAERVRRTFADLSVTGPEARPLRLSASFGVAEFRTGMTGDELVAAADRALYAAKRAGKNRVEASAETGPAPAPV